MQARISMNVAAHHRDLQTRERLPRRTQRAVIPRAAIATAAIHALTQVESDRTAAATQLPRKVSVLQLNPPEHRLQLLQNLQNNVVNPERIDSLSGALNCTPASPPACSRAPGPG